MTSFSPAKVAFFLSLLAFSFLYGFGAREWGWFPNDLLEQGWRQAKVVLAFGAPNFADARVYDRSGARTLTPDRVQPGVTLVTSMWEGEDGWRPEARILDREGRTLHRWRIHSRDLFPDSLDERRIGRRYLHGSHLMPDGDILLNIGLVGTVRLDACGTVEWRLPARSHHSIARAADGTFWIPGTSQEPRRASPDHPDGLPGLEDPVYHEQILRVAPDGTVLDSIHVLDVLYANDLERYIARAFHPQAGSKGPASQDITHMNDVEPLAPSMADEYPLFEAGDLVVSLRNLNLVFVVDPRTEAVKWHAADPFLMQHDPDFVGDGWIGLFDNNQDFTKRGTMLGGSRILAFRAHADSMEVRFPTPKSEAFYTDVQGKWQQLENGNMLLTESRAGRVVEVAPDGRSVWEWIQTPYDSTHVPVVTEGSRYSELTPAEVEEWACSAEKTVSSSAG